MKIRALITSAISTVLLMIIMNAQAAPGDIYFVDRNHPNANDNYSKDENSETTPWKTIQRAADLLTAGETVLVKNGIYTELKANIQPNAPKLGIKPQNSGVSGNPITYKAFPGHRPVIDQNGDGAGFYLENKHYIIIDGFEIRNIETGGVWNNYGCSSLPANDCSSNLRIQNNIIHDQDGGGNQGGLKLDGVSDSYIYNNIIYNISAYGDYRHLNSASIHSFNMRNVIIANNEFYNSGNGVFYKQAPEGEGNIVIRNNIIHDVGKGVWFSNAGNKSPAHINNKVHHNIVYNAPICVLAKQKDTPEQSRGLMVYNNTFDNCTLETNGFLDNSFFNNIYYADSGRRQLSAEHGNTGFWESKIVYSDYNNYYPQFGVTMDLYGSTNDYKSLNAWQNACPSGPSSCPETLSITAPGPDQNSLAVDPLFVDRSSRNYKLKPDSPMIGAGRGGQFDDSVGAITQANPTIGPDFTTVNPLAPLPPNNIKLIP